MPDGVLFGSSKAHKALRKTLFQNHRAHDGTCREHGDHDVGCPAKFRRTCGCFRADLPGNAGGEFRIDVVDGEVKACLRNVAGHGVAHVSQADKADTFRHHFASSSVRTSSLARMASTIIGMPQ